jgi:hypothetical protein
MPELWTAKAAFAHFGAEMRNPRWAWSAKSPNGETVVVTWWKDEPHRDSNGRALFDCRDHPRLNQWRGRHGNRDRIRNLAHARDYCRSLFRVVWAKARDTNERIWEPIERYPDDHLWMQLEYLDERTGEFMAKQVDHA